MTIGNRRQEVVHLERHFRSIRACDPKDGWCGDAQRSKAQGLTTVKHVEFPSRI
jgi:hypothetical protein